jgi:hypothetical protein
MLLRSGSITVAAVPWPGPDPVREYDVNAPFMSFQLHERDIHIE